MKMKMTFLVNPTLTSIFLVAFIASECSAFALQEANATREETPRDLAKEERNKEIVLQFYQALFGDKDFSVIDKYVDDNFIQHNPLLPDGKDALIKFVQNIFPPGTPKTKIHISRIIAEGDYVWMHFKNQLGPDQPEVAAVDIFRLKDGKLVELFDVIQPIPHKSLNPHPMFNILKDEYKIHYEYHRTLPDNQDIHRIPLTSQSGEILDL